MPETLNDYLRVCLQPNHLRRTVAIMLVVGTWLTLFNQGDILMSAEITFGLAGKIFLKYLTPFVVANWGLLSRKESST